MPIDELEPAIGEGIRQQTAREADLVVKLFERTPLGVGVNTRIQFVRHQFAMHEIRDAAEEFDYVAFS